MIANNKSLRTLLALSCVLLTAGPAFARGFGGFGGGGRSFGGFGGGGRSFSGFSGGGSHSFGGFSGGSGGSRDFGGAGRDFGGGNFGGGSFGKGAFGGAGKLPTDGGFGGVAGMGGHNPSTINHGDLQNQGQQIRNNYKSGDFSGNTFNKTNNVNVNANHAYGGYGGYGHYGGYGGYGGYHPYANGWAHGFAASDWYHGGAWGCPGGWGCYGWGPATAWTCMGLTTLDTFLGIGAMSMAAGANSQPKVTNVTYQGDTVYNNGQPVGSATEYYQQGQQLAAQAYQAGVAQGYDEAVAQNAQSGGAGGAGNNGGSGAGSGTAAWQPLGVFSLAEPGQTSSSMMLQLAINKDGIVRGNYINQLTSEQSQIYGALDKKTQRISWTIGQNTGTVFDTTLASLADDDSPVLVHYGPTNTQTMALIRLPKPPDEGANPAAPSS